MTVTIIEDYVKVENDWYVKTNNEGWHLADCAETQMIKHLEGVK